MKVIKIIWCVIAAFLLLIIFFNTVLTVTGAQSAVQASQLYNQAAMEILIIIAITLLINLFNKNS